MAIAILSHSSMVVNVKGVRIHIKSLIRILYIQTSNVTIMTKEVSIKRVATFIHFICQL